MKVLHLIASRVSAGHLTATLNPNTIRESGTVYDRSFRNKGPKLGASVAAQPRNGCWSLRDRSRPFAPDTRILFRMGARIPEGLRQVLSVSGW
jgi:hypothetical protein